ncbi:AAA domain-containing protein [Gracilibacillus marinus]|jgi:very-short-patch-repair endonuclease/phosphate starvation-inducible protein PhoH|uniref:AAA domain-containing protein n=1 Tax=Gracilibacillus marinus TaxID=630535 RepID=A0ABV8W174_9BACI
MKGKLQVLSDRLNDISRSNRSIRLLKLYNKWTFDLSELSKIEKNPMDVLLGLINNTSKLLTKEKADNHVALSISRKLTTLYRNIHSIEEETGLYDLYIGYPLIEGAMSDGTFVRAPLFLYPVRLERKKIIGVEWHVNPISDEAPQLNRTLFLALQKLSNIHVPESLYEEAETKALSPDIEGWSQWLTEHNFTVSANKSEQLQAVQEFTKETIPTFNNGSFHLNQQAVIGHFPQGNSAILQDYEKFAEMLEQGQEDLGIVSEFLDVNVQEVNEDVDNLPSNKDQSYQEKLAKEKNKCYVLDTDASQEKILDALDHEKGMVVHGPPGTGKSQVIVNMISNAMAKGQRVMLVTQKRAALDVVYQRLDALNLSSNVALLHDEKNDRKTFYQKLNAQLNKAHSYQDTQKEFDQLSEKIIRTEEKLDKVAHALFEVQSHGFRAYDLFGLSKTAKEQDKIIQLQGILDNLNKHNLADILRKVGTYGRYYDVFGNDNPVHDRKSFTDLELKDRITIIETLGKAINESEQSIRYLEHFDDEDITPAYSRQIDNKLGKIYDDLNVEDKKTLQKLRIWLWTTFTGKTIIEELLDGEKFSGLSSKEWPKLKESLTILYDLSQVTEGLFKQLESVEAYFKEDSIKKLKARISKGDIPLEMLKKKQAYIKEYFEELREMDRLYDHSSKEVQQIIDRLIERNLSEVNNLSEEWVEVAKQSAYIHWIDKIEREHPELDMIGTGNFQHLTEELKELLQKKQALTIHLLQNQMHQMIEKVKSDNPKAVKDIIYQTGKKRQLWSVRRLVNEFALKGLLDVIPVWLVSPEIVSAIFPLEEKIFDLVIFDEASQCTVENGIPSIYRGNKVVVAGDEQQLPPSSLFKGAMEEDEDDEQEEFEESQSLLNLAKRILPSSLLEWHYRSKSEELINFSNHAFYHGHMQIAPNVNHLQNPAAIQWHKSNGRWINQQNAVEAEDVVKLLRQKLIEDASKTIGIITFNAKQQAAIEDAIDHFCEEDAEFGVIYDQVMSRDLDERIFVKNIENVQGDERDIIIFSIAYAKNKEGKVYNRFGTLGHEGGENRLNVAITRAKQEIHLVASIEPHELNVTNAKNIGPKLLKSYMEYAKFVSELKKDKIEATLTNLSGEVNTTKQESSLQFDSPFEEEVYAKLTEIGYVVDTQVGMSGYRIDLAIVNPNDSSKYVLGIECDGAMYHSSSVARERDIYRQRFLEQKGWKIDRIWSRNWWKDPYGEIERIDQTIKRLIQEH